MLNRSSGFILTSANTIFEWWFSYPDASRLEMLNCHLEELFLALLLLAVVLPRPPSPPHMIISSCACTVNVIWHRLKYCQYSKYNTHHAQQSGVSFDDVLTWCARNIPIKVSLLSAHLDGKLLPILSEFIGFGNVLSFKVMCKYQKRVVWF